MEVGHVRLHRKLKESQIWRDPLLLKVWIWCIMEAGFEDRKLYGVELKRGQFITGSRAGAIAIGCPPTTFFRALQRLKQCNSIELKAERSFTVVTVCNYSIYNPRKKQLGTQAERKRNASGTQAEPSEGIKELRKGSISSNEEISLAAKRQIYPPQFESLWKAYPAKRDKGSKSKAFAAWKKHVPAADRELAITAATHYGLTEKATKGFAPDCCRWIPDWREWINPPRPSAIDSRIYDPEIDGPYDPYATD